MSGCTEYRIDETDRAKPEKRKIEKRKIDVDERKTQFHGTYVLAFLISHSVYNNQSGK
jgi:hypothetical protein